MSAGGVASVASCQPENAVFKTLRFLRAAKSVARCSTARSALVESTASNQR